MKTNKRITTISKITFFVIIILSITNTSSAEGNPLCTDLTNQINIGMTQDEVIRIAGKPALNSAWFQVNDTKVLFKGIWYCTPPKGEIAIFHAELNDGKVSKRDEFK